MTEVVLVEAVDAYTSVAVRGRLDATGVGEVEPKLTSHTVARRKPAVIDLTEVGIISSVGIGMLVAIARSLRSHGIGIAVVASPHVRSILELTHTGALIPVVATREEALRTLGLA